MRRRQDHGVGVSFPQYVDQDAVTVDGYSDYLEPGGSRCREGVVAGRRVLQHESLRAGGSQYPDKQSYALRVSGGDHDVIRVSERTADPVQVVRDRRPQLRHAASGQVAEDVVRRGGECAADRPQPRCPGETGHVRAAIAQVDSRRLGAGQAQRCHQRRRASRYLRVPAGMAGQIALGRQLLVGLDHNATRDAKVVGQNARGRQRRAARQPPGANRVTDRRGDLPVQRSPLAPAEHDEQSRIGPGSVHRTGPYQQDRFLAGSKCIADPWPSA